jgi:hypothetical protein
MGAGLTALALLGTPAASDAQRLEVNVLPGTISIASADPDTTPVVSAAPAMITYRVRGNGNDPWLLTVLASGDLRSGPSTIPISQVSWTATPAPPFRNGTLSSSIAQTVASGNGNVNPLRIGFITFRLTNSWTYDVGVYTQTVVFTLSAP